MSDTGPNITITELLTGGIVISLIEPVGAGSTSAQVLNISMEEPSLLLLQHRIWEFYHNKQAQQEHPRSMFRQGDATTPA